MTILRIFLAAVVAVACTDARPGADMPAIPVDSGGAATGGVDSARGVTAPAGESGQSAPGASAVAGSAAGSDGANAPAGTAGASVAARRDSMGPFPLVPTPDTVRGLYVNRWAAVGQRMWELIDVAKRTEVNALVIDVKDDRGFVLYRSGVSLARAIGADTNTPMSHRRMRMVLDTMRAHGIYPIARIVVAKDPLLAEHRQQFAIRKRADTTQVWLDRNGTPWLDPTHQEIWKYSVDLAAEAVGLGFSEVQFDYVRFPDEDRVIREGYYAKLNGRIRAQVIRDQLAYVARLVKPLGVPNTIDVFGLTATDTTDMGIGQKWELFIDRADVVLPMVYPSHYAPGTFKLANPNARPYETIAQSLKDMKARTRGIANAAKIVPWYQDFTLGPPRYGPAEVRAQIKAGEDNGIPDWILWNPRSVYNLGALRSR
ncbi:MAG: GTP-binding protein [Gemmatimonadaceae bacterium]|nr:GTP-binding protein [Gemmatimonadaceae bacterium]